MREGMLCVMGRVDKAARGERKLHGCSAANAYGRHH